MEDKRNDIAKFEWSQRTYTLLDAIIDEFDLVSKEKLEKEDYLSAYGEYLDAKGSTGGTVSMPNFKKYVKARRNESENEPRRSVTITNVPAFPRAKHLYIPRPEREEGRAYSSSPALSTLTAVMSRAELPSLRRVRRVI